MNHNSRAVVRFDPWVGTNYSNGGGIFRQRTLILGGSHYAEDSSSFYTEGGQHEWQEFTKEIINSYLSTEGGGGWRKTFTCFINSVIGRATRPAERSEFFKSVAFYNYLQELAGTSSSEAGNYDYTEARHFDAFVQILDDLSPDVVISWGSKVWDALPNDWGYGAAAIGEPTFIDGKNAGSVYSYPFQEKTIRLIGVRHPSSCFSREFHHKLFKHHGVLA